MTTVDQVQQDLLDFDFTTPRQMMRGELKKMSSRSDKKQKKGRDTGFTCPECGSKEVVQDLEKGERICSACGLVVSEHRIDHGPEWRAFTADEKDARSRAGAPTNYAIHDKGLSTMIDWRDHDSQGKRFSAKKRSEIYRLRKWQIRTRVHSSVDRNLAQAMSELDRLSSQLGLTKSIKELAALLYRKLIVRRLARSRSIDAMVGASIYAACRLRKAPRSLEEIARHSRVNRKKIGQHYRLLVEKLQIRMPISDPANYVPRFITELGLPGIVQQKVIEILEMAKTNRTLITGRDPRGLAAAAIYIASILTDHRVTQRDIAMAAGVTEV
ncbi:MAG: transcription initiation factor IIB, partial [Candidatus Thorarchaeota archaeon]|nr:transcription initiation factor IIB [Candidatus Thorarchaeota archaeon]